MQDAEEREFQLTQARKGGQGSVVGPGVGDEDSNRFTSTRVSSTIGGTGGGEEGKPHLYRLHPAIYSQT